ncbi:MAG: hypothetical protein ACR2QO_07375 [Acidimicrobiales bacterium]
MTDFARPDQTSPLDGGQRTAVAETAGHRQAVADQHRYTGPELSALLNQVRLELGTEANIVEANRVRSGGVAGFFAKESYEVVVAAPAGATTTRRAVPAPTPEAPPARTPPSEPPRRSPRSPAEISIALLERAEAISALERASVQRHPDDAYDLRDRAPARFAAVLDAELASEPDTAPQVEREATPAAPTPVREAPPPILASVDGGPSNEERAVELGVDVDSDGSDYAPLGLEWAPDPEPVRPPSPVRPALPIETSTSANQGASGVQGAPQIRGAREIPSVPEMPRVPEVQSGPETMAGRSLTVVGSLEAAVAMARHVVSDPLSEYADFVVVTPNPDALDLPGSRAGRHYEAVTRHLFDWAVRGRNGIVVVDVALGSRLRAEVLCVRHLGVDSVYVVDDQLAPAANTLEQLDGVADTIVIEALPNRGQATDAKR